MLDATTIFAALGGRTRLRFVTILANGEACVGDLVLDLPQPMVSRHLAALRRAALVHESREA